METRAFHICPFCQAQCPLAASRCVRCHRALADLPLPVYGSELDAEMRPNASADLVDLPLRDTAADAARPPIAPVAAAPPGPHPSPRRPFQRRRDGRKARLGVAAGLMGGAALLGAAVLLGGWLVRAQDRDKPEPPAITTAAAPATTPPAATVPAATGPAATVPSATTPAPRVPPTVAEAIAPPVTAAPAPPWAKPASPRTVEATAPPPVRVASPVQKPTRPATDSREEATLPPAAYPVPPARRPAAEVIRVHPDVAAAPVDVERARDDFEPDAPAETRDAGARAALRARLDRALEHRDAVAARVRDLRARTDVPVIKDVEEYQRLQNDLSAALDELDQAETEVRRFQRALRRRGE